MLAISGASVLLTVTWSAAPAPAPTDGWVAAQRAAVAADAAGVAAGRELDLPIAVIGAAGVAFVAGLVLLAALAVVTVRQGVERRFDVAVGAYVAGLVAGMAAATMGAVLASGRAPAGQRDAHVTLNLLGLVGSSWPARSRSSPPRRAAPAWPPRGRRRPPHRSPEVNWPGPEPSGDLRPYRWRPASGTLRREHPRGARVRRSS